ncbi:MAG: hypothetical protein K8U57_04370 [Planctomycetes bacterium]|nr:hypothetical protein [Planctomycetota bacterium]
MTLAKRITTLERLVPRGKKGRPVPDDPVAFARGLLARQFAPADIDPTDPNHTGWLTRVYTFLITLTPEHQAWEREIGIGGTGIEPVGFEALDAVMRRG